MNRRRVVLAGIASGLGALALARPALAAPARIEVFKSPTCGCCTAWIDHLRAAGFAPLVRDVDQETLWQVKARAGIAPELGSCHTAFVAGYVVEGHVPASDVRRLLAERPEARGLAVPGMPIGSPGMEMGDRREAFDTLLVRRDGGVEVFASHL